MIIKNQPEEVQNCLQKQIRLMEELSFLSNECFILFNLKTNRIHYVKSINPFTKVTIQTFYSFYRNILKEDRIVLKCIKERAAKFLKTKDVDEIENYCFKFCFKMLIENREREVTCKVKPLLTNNSGDILITLGCLEITKNTQRPMVENYITGERHYFKPTKSLIRKMEITNLTEQEKIFLSFIAKGYQKNQIAQSLQIKEATYKRHRSNLYKKLKVNNKLEAINRAFICGLLE